MNTNERYWRIENGDVLDMLATMEDDSFDGLLMDSPYGLTFMEKKWDESLPCVKVCGELLRVAKPGAMLLAFGSPRTYHRLTCHLEDAGWKIRDCLMWLHGQGFPKSHNISKAIDKKLGAKRKVVGTKPNPHRGVRADHQYRFQPPDMPVEITVPATPEAQLWNGYGTGLKPAWEPILVAMKPLIGTFAKNALVWGCGALDIDACRVGTNGGTARSHQAPYPQRPDGREDRSQCWARTGHEVAAIDKGRWPANVILDEVAAEQLDQQNPTSKSSRSIRRKAGSNVGNGKTMHSFTSRRLCREGYEDAGGPSRFFYCAKASKRERNAGLDGFSVKRPDVRSESGMGSFKEKGVQPQQNHHPCVKPLRLCQYLAKLILPPAGFRKLLIPYCGSGSEMLGALMAGWDYVIGIECEAEYVEIAKRRLAELDAA
jgi:site-specific DNA-methyltransferase (adenine-specific)